MLCTGLVSESGLAPGGYRTGTADGRLTFTASVRMVVRVHYGTEYRGTNAEVTGASCLTDFNVFVIAVAYGTYGSHADCGNVTKLAGGETKESILAFFSHELCGVACRSCELTASAGIKLNVVYKSTYGNIYKGKGVARLDIRRRTCNDGVADFESLRSENVILYSVLILNEGNLCGAIGIVLQCFNFCLNIELISLEIDNTILTAVSAAVMANGDSSVTVTAGML